MKQYKSKTTLFFATAGWWLLEGISYVFRILLFVVMIICFVIGAGAQFICEWTQDKVLSIKPEEYECKKTTVSKQEGQD